MTASEYLYVSEVGFKNANAYDAHRPSYPPEAVSSLLSHMDLAGQAGARIVDLAAGTGKFTELLAARGEGYDIVAVEPTGSMRETLRGKELRGTRVLEGTAEGMGIDSGSADGVVAAQSFHWFANEDALREIHRVLKPGAILGMIWNVEDYHQPPDWQATSDWERAIKSTIVKLDGFGPPRFRQNAWRAVFTSQTEPLFATPLQTQTMPWTTWLSREKLWDRIGTLSHVVNMSPAEKASFRELFDGAVTEGRGEFNYRGEVGVHGVTYMAWTRRL